MCYVVLQRLEQHSAPSTSMPRAAMKDEGVPTHAITPDPATSWFSGLADRPPLLLSSPLKSQKSKVGVLVLVNGLHFALFAAWCA
jgi:hypothetical protein